jgi:hypothetical protein
MLGPFPKEVIVGIEGKIARTWDVWMNALQNHVDKGQPASKNTDISAALGVRVVSDKMRIQSATAGNTTVTLNPQISKGFDGQHLMLEGLDDTKTVTIRNADGVSLKSGSTFVIGEDDIIELNFNESKNLWIEKSNNN